MIRQQRHANAETPLHDRDVPAFAWLDRRRVRFHITHVMTFVAIVALVLGLVRHPEALWAGVVPLVGGVFVVLPMLGLVEWLTPHSSNHTDLSWGAAIAATLVAMVGSIVGLVVTAMLLSAFW